MASGPGRSWHANVTGTVALTTTQTVAAVAHGLGSAPAFVLATLIGAATAGTNTLTAEATGTTVTFSTANTTASKTIAYLISKQA